MTQTLGYVICTYYPFNEGAPCRVWAEVVESGYGWSSDGGNYLVFATLEDAQWFLGPTTEYGTEDRDGVNVLDMHIQRLDGTPVED